MLEEIKQLKLPREQWKPYPDNTNFWVSNKGRVYSIKRAGTKGKLMSPSLSPKGYLAIHVGYQKAKNQRSFVRRTIHRMVLETFKRPRKPWEVCNHKDGDKQNNNLSNLEWVTQQENVKHSIEVIETFPVGSKNVHAKLTEREAMFLCWLRGTYGDTIQALPIARFFGISDAVIWDLWKGKKWKHLQKIK